MLRTVDMRAKLATFLSQLAYASEREHLKTARIGEDGAIPTTEGMKTACLAQDVKTGTEVEMIGVAEDNLCLHLLTQFGKVHPLDTAAGAYGHEYGCKYLTMVGGYLSRTGVRRIVSILQLKLHLFSSSSSISNVRALSTFWLSKAKSHTSCTFST